MSRSRRAFLAAAGAAAFAGCTGSGGGGSGGDGGGSGSGSESGSNAGTGSTAAGSGSGTGTGTGSGSGSSSGSKPADVGEASLLLNWKPGGLHAPYYAAKAEGFYEAEGLTLTDVESGQGSDFSAKQVALENTPFAVTSGDQMVNINSRNLSPLAVGVVMQRNPVVVFSTRKTFGGELTDASQLAGKTVGTGPGMVRIMTELLLDDAGVSESVELVDTGFDTVQQLLAGKIDAAGGAFSDAVDARNQGFTTDSVPVASAVPAYGHVLATEPGFAKEHPRRVRAFLRGTARGAVWATRNPANAIDHVVSAVPELEASRDVELDEWRLMSSQYMLSEAVRTEGWGWSARTPWQATYEALRGADLLDGSVDPASVWTNEYIDTDYEYIGSYAERVSGATSTSRPGSTTTTESGSGSGSGSG